MALNKRFIKWKGSAYLANRNFEVGEIYIVPRGMGGELFDNDIIVITEITPQPTGKILVGYVIVNNYRSTYRCKRGYFSARSPMAYSLIKLNPKELFPEKEIKVMGFLAKYL